MLLLIFCKNATNARKLTTLIICNALVTFMCEVGTGLSLLVIFTYSSCTRNQDLALISRFWSR